MAENVIQVEFRGQMVEVKSGSTVRQWLDSNSPADLSGDNPVVIASINGRRTHLAEPLRGDERVRLIRLQDKEAQTTIQRTVQFLAALATEDIFPGQTLTVNFSYAGGMYCEIAREEPLTEAEVTAIAERMTELVVEDLPLVPHVMLNAKPH